MAKNRLWETAKKYIPGGNMFLSKRPERFLPGKWPTYFKKSSGCYVYDLDNRKYIDMIMSIGTNVLGYSDPEVNRAVIKSIKKGNMSTLNCTEELNLAKKLVEIHKWSDSVKFARTGGEANAIAIRISRSFNKRTNIAICGYHGWHDWYLSTNLTKKNSLKDHLLSGLSTDGVPKKLKNTVFSFKYNDIQKFKQLVSKKNLSAVMMEVSRNYKPKNNFLNEIRKLTKKKNITLIFDECTSGFRQTYGGLHKLYKINPDIAVFGKCIGNGYPLTAIVGSQKIMKHAQNSFISSTFWSERTGYVAALKTLEIMKRKKTWKIITKTGNEIKKKWREKAKKYDLEIEILGLPAICSFNFKSKNSKKYITFLTQEMLKNRILANNSVYVSIKHNKQILEKYFSVLDRIFRLIKLCELKKMNINNLLESKTFKESFFRLN